MQMSWKRQHILLSYFKKLSVGPVFQMFIGKDTSMVKDFISFLTLTELSNNAQPMLDEHDATNFSRKYKNRKQYYSILSPLCGSVNNRQ